MRYGFVIDNRRCIGCHACTVACKAEHSIPVGVNRTWVKYVEKGEFPHSRRYFTVQRCMHCDNAPCVTICPVRALFTRDDGIVDFDKERCIGCRSCMQACPYDALYIDPETQTSAKCNFCAHRVEKGIEPSCVVVCPGSAIIAGDLDDPHSHISHVLARAQAVTRRPEKGTAPKLFYIHADQAALSPDLAPPRLAYMQAEQSAGVGHHAPRGKGSHPNGGHSGDGLFNSGHSKNSVAAMGDAAPGLPQPTARSLDEGGAGIPQRVYDAPAKGVLWGWEIPGYLWTKSISAGLLFVAVLLQELGSMELPLGLNKAAGVTALVFLALTGALLVKDLDRPGRFHYVLLRPQWSSWLVRGGYIINALGLSASLWTLMLFAEFTAGRQVLGWIMAASALAAATYTAFLFAQAKGRDLWQSPVLPLHMLTQSVMAGAGALILLSLALGFSPAPEIALVLQWALIAHLGLLAVEFNLPHVTSDTMAALWLISHGPYRLAFWSAVALGNLLPLGLLFFAGAGAWLPVAAVLVLGFAVVIEWIWVRAPQLVPMR